MVWFSALAGEEYALEKTQRENQTFASMLHDVIMLNLYSADSAETTSSLNRSLNRQRSSG